MEARRGLTPSLPPLHDLTERSADVAPRVVPGAGLPTSSKMESASITTTGATGYGHSECRTEIRKRTCPVTAFTRIVRWRFWLKFHRTS